MDGFLGNRYEILGELGAGGMALVYRARDLALGRIVAIKVLRPEYGADLFFVARFQQEARSAAALTHPNIVTIHDVGEADGYQYIVMEYVEGVSLKELIRAGVLTMDRAAAIAAQICAGLAFAHEHGITHRDVKPQNVLVVAPNQDPRAIGTAQTVRAKLTDFGIAQAAGIQSFTRDNEVLGSVHYMAPEQVQGLATGPAVDQYATGCVLYEMLTGQQPFQGDTTVAIALAHIQEAPRPPRELNPAIPPALEATTLRAMAKRAEDRFPSAAEMEAVLQSVLRSGLEPTGAVPAVASAIPRASTRFTRPVNPVGSGPPIATLPRDDQRGIDWVFVVLVALTSFWLAGGLLLVTGGALNRQEGLLAIAPTAAPNAGKTGQTPTPPPTPGPTPAPAVQILAPSMVGVDVDRARRIVEDQGLRLRVESAQFSDELPENTIIRQTPEPGTALERGGEVVVVVSRGPQLVAVPGLAGLGFDEAARRATLAGFTVERVNQPSGTVREGVVISQNPAAGQNARPGTTIRLVVSQGTPRPVMPDVIGRPLDDALRILRDANLRVPESNINRQGPEQVPDEIRRQFCIGCVMSTDPGPGREVVPGQDVRVAVRRE